MIHTLLIIFSNIRFLSKLLEGNIPFWRRARNYVWMYKLLNSAPRIPHQKVKAGTVLSRRFPEKEVKKNIEASKLVEEVQINPSEKIALEEEKPEEQ